MSPRQQSRTKSDPSTNGDGPGEGPSVEDDVRDLKAELNKVLTGATKDTFDRGIRVIAKLLLDRGLEESDAALDAVQDALYDTGHELGLTSRQLAAIANRLAENVKGQKDLKDAASGNGPESKQKKASGDASSALLKLARGAFDFSLSDQGLVATPKDGGEPLRGTAFLDQLAFMYEQATGSPPTAASLRSAIGVLTGEAQHEAPPVENDTFDDIPDESGAELLNDLASFITRFVILPFTDCVNALALWVLHTWSFGSFVVTPRLIIRSASKRCGKSRVLEVLYCLCAKPKLAIMPSAAAITRLSDAVQPVWLLDEFDNTMKSNQELVSAITAVVNEGYRLGATVPKVDKDGDRFSVIDFSIFTPVAMAGIGYLTDTTEDRSVVINIERKLKDERTEDFHIVRTFNEAEHLRRRCAAWAARNAEALSQSRPEVPEALDDRAIECWETLTAVAERAGGEWLPRANTAAEKLSGPGRSPAPETTEMSLLSDLRDLWHDSDNHWGSRVPSEDICRGLADLEESEWATFSRGEPVTQAALGKLLRPFGIRSRKMRPGPGDAWVDADDDAGLRADKPKPRRGYVRADFVPVWERLLAPFEAEMVLDGTEGEAG